MMTARTSAIDMFTPKETGNALGLDDQAVLGLVNSGRLAAYELGGNIRFKQVDVQAVLLQLSTLQLAVV